MQEWKSISYGTAVDIAIGPNAVTNLLDMMTLTRLSKLVIEDYWAPEVIGPEHGPEFLKTFIDLEEDIWTIADDVLTERQQQEMKQLITEWHEENPDQVYPWLVRLSDFSGQRAASLAAVQETGGLLREVARAREAAEEIQAFGERVLFYLQRAPMITSSAIETSATEILGGPELTRAMDNVERFVTSVERLVETVNQLPGNRLAAVDQLMDRVGEERRALLTDIASSESQVSNLIAELLPVIESVERSIAVAKQRSPDSRPFDINEYRGFVAESTTTAMEMRQLVEAVDRLVGNSTELSAVVASLVEAEHAMVDRLFLQAIALIFIFFAALFVYRLVTARLLSK
jgi:uncharacterized protein Yka (UPF0111/DUF47 family)